MKAAREMQRQIVSFVAVTVAARLSVRNSASSPKKSLALSLRDTSPSSPTLVHLTSPVLMMKNSCPSSPCARAGVALSRRGLCQITSRGRGVILTSQMMLVPASKSLSTAVSASSRFAASPSEASRRTLPRKPTTSRASCCDFPIKSDLRGWGVQFNTE